MSFLVYPVVTWVSDRSQLIGCCSLYFTKNVPPWPPCCSSSVASSEVMTPTPLLCAPMNMLPRWRSVVPSPPLGDSPGMVVGYSFLLTAIASNLTDIFLTPAGAFLLLTQYWMGACWEIMTNSFSDRAILLIRKLHYTDISGYKGKAQDVTAILAILKGTG